MRVTLRNIIAVAFIIVFAQITAHAGPGTKVGEFSGTPISPTALSGTVDDWAPTGLVGATIIFASTSGAATLDGLTGGVDGRFIAICNAGTFTLTVADEATGSLAANRFSLPNGDAVPLASTGNNCLGLIYDGTNSRWKEYASSSQPGNQNLSILSPSPITGTVNDWSPTGWTSGTATVIEVSLSNTTALNGLVALNVGSVAVLCNMSASFDLTITDEAAGSTAANRFENQGGLIKLSHHSGPEPECATYIYDGTLARWMSMNTTASTLHALTLTSGLVVQSSGASVAGGFTATLGGGPFTINSSNVGANMTSTFDTTSGGITATNISCNQTASRSAGANNLTNVCANFAASGGQINQSITTTTGDEVFNSSSGSATFDGLATFAAGATVSTGQTLTWSGATVAGAATLSGANSVTGTFSSTGNFTWTNTAHLKATGTAPGLGAGCGTGATVTGSDIAGTVAENSTSFSAPCVVTFHTSFGTAPTCTVTPEAIQATFTYVPAAATLTVTNTSAESFDYICIGH